MELEKRLIDIERKLWTNDAVLYKDNLIEEAVLVFPETGVITREIAVDAILTENAEGRKWAEVEFDEVRVVPFIDDVALLTYRVSARWQHDGPRFRRSQAALMSSAAVYGKCHSISRRPSKEGERR